MFKIFDTTGMNIHLCVLVSRVLCLLFGCASAFDRLCLLLIPLLACGSASMQSRCLFNAKGDSLDQMWPSGPHLTFGLLALLALIGIFVGKRRSSFSKFDAPLLNPLIVCSSDCLEFLAGHCERY